MMVVVLMVWLFGYIIAVFIVHIAVMVNVIEEPTLPNPWWWLIVIYTLAADLGMLLSSSFFLLPVRYSDVSVLVELAHLRKTDEAAFKRKLDELNKAR